MRWLEIVRWSLAPRRRLEALVLCFLSAAVVGELLYLPAWVPVLLISPWLAWEVRP